MYMYTYIYMDLWIHVYAHTRTHRYICRYIYNRVKPIYVHVHTHTHIGIYVCIYTIGSRVRWVKPCASTPDAGTSCRLPLASARCLQSRQRRRRTARSPTRPRGSGPNAPVPMVWLARHLSRNGEYMNVYINIYTYVYVYVYTYIWIDKTENITIHKNSKKTRVKGYRANPNTRIIYM